MMKVIMAAGLFLSDVIALTLSYFLTAEVTGSEVWGFVVMGLVAIIIACCYIMENRK